MAEITGQQIKPLREALLGAFKALDFALMLSDYLGEDLDNLAPVQLAFPYRVQEVIGHYNRRDEVERLLRAAQAHNPTNRRLREVAAALRIGAEFTPSAYTDSELQRVIDKNLGFINGRQFREQWARAERQVCRIEFPAQQHRGSGFLVGSDLVLTNYHVMQAVIDNPKHASEVVLRFDYENNLAGSTSAITKLADDWRIDYSLGSPKDEDPNAFDTILPDQLDYALLRLSEKLGDQLLPGSTTETRGWVKPPLLPHDFVGNPYLAIVQYPENRVLSSSWDNQAFIKLNANATRVRYRANSENGSSGSPCFNINWELVALHHLGGPRLAPAANTFNQGIPFPTILALLEQHGVIGELDK